MFDSEEYLKVKYPKNSDEWYPSKLAELLIKRFSLDNSIFDIGCGQGDMLRAFDREGLSCKGVDLSPSSKERCSPIEVLIHDLSKELPLEDCSISNIFSKSVIEHLTNPILLLKEMYRTLEVEGKIIVMTPSWEHTYWGPFYIDPTHIRPFTKKSLEDAMKMSGFKEVKVEYFYQLPFLWKFPFFKPAINLFSKIPLPYRPYKNSFLPERVIKLIRFSKEVMLLGYGVK